MSLLIGYLWACCAVAVLVSLVLGVVVLAGGPGREDRARWPLFGAVTAVCLALQVGYVAAPLVVRAEGEWWRWAVVSMAPMALLSMLAVATNVRLYVRQRLKGGGASVRVGRFAAVCVLAGVYLLAPIAVWAVRS